jgi:hypothetical protein
MKKSNSRLLLHESVANANFKDLITPGRTLEGRKKNKRGVVGAATGTGIVNDKSNHINQLEMMEVTLNVKKIELPKNEAPEIVAKLREANKLIEKIEVLK